MFYTASVSSTVLKSFDAQAILENEGYKKDEDELYTQDVSTGLFKRLKHDMRRLFVNGKLSTYWIAENGDILKADKSTKLVSITKWNKDKNQLMVSFERPFNMSKSIPLAELLAEHFLLEKGHSASSYEISFKDNKPKNCSLSNMIVKQKGNAGVALKKAVKVSKKGQFYAIFDSVKSCAESLNIPRRKVSDLLKSGEMFKKYNIEVFK